MGSKQICGAAAGCAHPPLGTPKIPAQSGRSHQAQRMTGPSPNLASASSGLFGEADLHPDGVVLEWCGLCGRSAINRYN